MDLIVITKDSSPGGLQDRKVAHLTGKARAELERGLGGTTTAGIIISDEPESIEVSRERFVEMERRLEQLTKAKKSSSTQTNEVDELRERVDEVEREVNKLKNFTVPRTYAILHLLEDSMGRDDVDEILTEWKGWWWNSDFGQEDAPRQLSSFSE